MSQTSFDTRPSIPDPTLTLSWSGWNGSEALIGVEDPNEYRFVKDALLHPKPKTLTLIHRLEWERGPDWR